MNSFMWTDIVYMIQIAIKDEPLQEFKNNHITLFWIIIIIWG